MTNLRILGFSSFKLETSLFWKLLLYIEEGKETGFHGYTLGQQVLDLGGYTATILLQEQCSQLKKVCRDTRPLGKRASFQCLVTKKSFNRHLSSLF